MRLLAPIAILLLAGCGQAENDREATEVAAPAPGPRACDVLTQADAAEALGREVRNLNNDGGVAGLDICQFGYEGERLMDTGNVSVTIQAGTLEQARVGLAAQQANIEELSGIGDAALFSQYGLYAEHGGRTAIYLLAAGGMSEAEAKERAIALARKSINRL